MARAAPSRGFPPTAPVSTMTLSYNASTSLTDALSDADIDVS